MEENAPAAPPTEQLSEEVAKLLAGHITIQGAEFAYPVVIQPGALTNVLPDFVRARGFKRCAVISNTTVGPLYGESLVAQLPGAFLITVPDGEQHKTLDTVRTIYDQMFAAGADRATLVIGLGGGVIGDMAGFVAATFMRGVAYIQAPTSLLAMVDASLGGKVGVDMPQGKNLVGAFKDPLAVIEDTATLKTLPEVEFQCGMAEAIKHGFLADATLLDHLRKHGPEPIDDVLRQAVLVKKHVVEQDRLESGMRAYLNLGHTFGHAIEQASGYSYKHGQGVAIGMAAAVHLAARRGLCDPGLVEDVEVTLIEAGLPVRYADLNPGDLWEAMGTDKKWRDGQARFVLIKAVGEPVIVSDVTRDEVIAVLEEVRE
ncbi:MAG: 3-dehydroquinate synthase [Anaerolineae bacterium]|nr:3-dehydroquinate synthase [Anaerolineae bacterium]